MTASLSISFHWDSNLQGQGMAYKFPERCTKFFREHFCGPSIYRWRIMPAEPGKLEPVYIGEGQDLARRVQRYKTPASKKNSTTRRLKTYFEEQITNGKIVILDRFVLDEAFEINGLRFSTGELGNVFKRRALEQVLIAIAQRDGHTVLNKFFDPAEKATKILEALDPEKRKRVLEIMQQMLHDQEVEALK